MQTVIEDFANDTYPDSVFYGFIHIVTSIDFKVYLLLLNFFVFVTLIFDLLAFIITLCSICYESFKCEIK